jgi:hypothetical protein
MKTGQEQLFIIYGNLKIGITSNNIQPELVPFYFKENLPRIRKQPW